MLETGERADAVYELTVVRHGRRWSRPLRVAGSFVAALLTLDAPRLSVGDYVVRRRADGREVLRVEGDTAGESVTADHLREQLRTQTAAEFRETWGLTD